MWDFMRGTSAAHLSTELEGDKDSAVDAETQATAVNEVDTGKHQYDVAKKVDNDMGELTTKYIWADGKKKGEHLRRDGRP